MAKRLDKPIRLYALTIFIVLGYGIFPFVSVLPFLRGFWLFGPRILPFNGSPLVLYDANGEAPVLLVIISVLLAVFCTISAVAAFYDLKEGRVAALVLVTADVLWWSFLVIMAIMNNENPGEAAFKFGSQLIFPPFFLAVVWWNFTRPDIGAYYKQQSEAGK